jgi:hypothetical protein
MPHRTLPAALRALALTFVILFACPWPADTQAADGAWREKTQVVWNRDAGALIRRNFRVWDPHPELNLDFLWEPRSSAGSEDPDGIVNGPGTLTWHAKDSPTYDRQFVHSVFKGVLRNGRPEGEGALLVRNGDYYTGQWVDGAMHGRGILRFANGDRYDGDFVAGQMHGVGKYASTDGSVYFGEFRNGRRDGIGRLMNADGAYRTVWRKGEEISRQEIEGDGRVNAAPRLRQAAAANGVKLKVSLDQKKFIDFENADPDAESHPYEAENTPGGMTIRLASREILKTWKGDAPLQIGEYGGVLSTWQFPPVYLKVEVENGGGRPARISNAFLDVFDSTTDVMPHLELHPDWSAGDVYTYKPSFHFENIGWGRVRDSRIIYSLGTDSRRTGETTVRLGTFDASKQVSIVDRLRQLGVDVNRLKRANEQRGSNHPGSFNCGHDDVDLTVCFEKLKNSGILGRFRDYVFRQADDSIVYTTLSGRIEYQWAGHDGRSNARVSPFSVDVPLLKFNEDQAEGGGLEVLERPFKALALSLDRRSYRIALPGSWNVDVGQAQTKQLDLTVSAAKSSRHSFQIVLQLADGALVKSPTIDLSYFRPRVAAKFKPRFSPFQ